MNKRARGLHDDPLSAASAGLVALGIERSRRVDVLDVLGCLIDHADASGHVVLDRELFTREEALGVDKCLDAYALLEQLDVVERTEQGWLIADYAAHNGPLGETEASLAVLRRHLASVGREAVEAEVAAVAFDSAPTRPVVHDIAPVTPLRRLRRAVPIAAGLAASAAVVAGVTQFVPQAAVSGRNAALTADAPTTIVRGVSPTSAGRSNASVPAPSAVAGTATTALNATSTTNAPVPGVACLVPKVVTVVTSVDIVKLGLGDRTSVWAAVVKGTATLTDSASAVLLPALNVVAHVAGGDTDAVQATLGAPLLQPNKAAPFNAVVVLGSVKPTEKVTATATAAGLPTC